MGRDTDRDERVGGQGVTGEGYRKRNRGAGVASSTSFRANVLQPRYTQVVSSGGAWNVAASFPFCTSRVRCCRFRSATKILKSPPWRVAQSVPASRQVCQKIAPNNPFPAPPPSSSSPFPRSEAPSGAVRHHKSNQGQGACGVRTTAVLVNAVNNKPTTTDHHAASPNFAHPESYEVRSIYR